jgi:hypothetical protein
MGTTLTICRGCLRHAEGHGDAVYYQTRISAIQQRIESQLGPVTLQVEDCLHHCLDHEVCLQLDHPGRRRPRCAHLKQEATLADPVDVLLGR